jgi:acyl carrier protein
VEPPRSEVERIITDVFAETTAQDVVGRHDDFFADLGGHSLLATRAVARLRTALRREIPLALLFERPTAATLGDLVESLALASDEDLGPIPRVDRSQFRTDRAVIV